MDFALPADLIAYLAELDAFIEAEIKPLEQQDDNIRFFDHRREWARTDFEHGGLPRREWELLLREASMRADKAGHWRFSAPKKYGGKDGSNLWMAVIRDKFAAKGLAGARVDEIADACEMSRADVRAAMRAADVREGRCTLWCASATCQSYARGETHATTLDRALALGWRHDLRARLLCPRCTR